MFASCSQLLAAPILTVCLCVTCAGTMSDASEVLMALYEHLDKVPKPHAQAPSIVDFTFGMNVQVSWLHPCVGHAASH